MGEVRIRARNEASFRWMSITEAQRLIEAEQIDTPISGTVYGVALNTLSQQVTLSDAFGQAPYKAPPEAPVLYIKTANTLNRHGGTVEVPNGVEALEVNATLAVVIGRTACRVSAKQALDHVLGYTIALDVCEPHASYYRPAIRQRCRDGFLPVGPWLVARHDVTNPESLTIAVSVNGSEASRWSTDDLVRPVARLIADVSDFMTLNEGDVLLVGLAPNPAQARVGDHVSAHIDGHEGFGELTVILEGEAA